MSSISSTSRTRCGGPATNRALSRGSGMIRRLFVARVDVIPVASIIVEPKPDRPLVRLPNVPEELDEAMTRLSGMSCSSIVAASVASAERA